jgi:hypothetical protein
MMTDEFLAKTVSLIERLTAATNQDRLVWNESDRPDAYVCQFPSQNVVIATIDDDGIPPYELQIITKEGALGESFNTREIGLENEMRKLHTSARRNAKGIDKLLDTLLEELPPMDEPPF